jgi:tRNA G18 (ribose-2'-O)-methylase SpoU
MNLVPIDDVADDRLAPYRAVGDPQLLREHGLFVAEGRLVVERLLLESDYRVHSLLVSEASARALRSVRDQRPDVGPIFVAAPDLIERLTGFDFHRGCLALAHRPSDEEARARVAARLDDARLVVALDHVGNSDNVGAIFRNAEAFGAAAVVLSATSCDPLYRRSIRVSMGSVLRLPGAKYADFVAELEDLRRRGFRLVALTPGGERPLGGVPATAEKSVLIFGAEGAGLSPEVASMADLRVRIPLAPRVDSLNVATASGIALHWWFHAR